LSGLGLLVPAVFYLLTEVKELKEKKKRILGGGTQNPKIQRTRNVVPAGPAKKQQLHEFRVVAKLF